MHAKALNFDLRIATVRAENWGGMVRYYSDSLGLKQRFADEAAQYAMFDAGPIRLAIEGSLKPAFARGIGSGATVLNFQVEDLALALEGFAATGAHVLTEVRHGPGYDFVALGDPEGNECIIFQRTGALA